jgi:hypothetical protein
MIAALWLDIHALACSRIGLERHRRRCDDSGRFAPSEVSTMNTPGDACDRGADQLQPRSHRRSRLND